MQIIARKRSVYALLPELNKQMVQRNKEITSFLKENATGNTKQLNSLNKISQLLSQSINDEIDLPELIAIEENFDKHYEALISHSANTTEMEHLFEGRLIANLKLNQTIQAFNTAVTYHNNSVIYFPTKLLAKILGYKAVPLLKTNNINDFKQWKEIHLPAAIKTP